MDFSLTGKQADLVRRSDEVFQKRAGGDRARALAGAGQSDRDLLGALRDEALLDVSPLDAVLISEAAAYAAAFAPVSQRLLVAPVVLDQPPLVVGLAEHVDEPLVRFGADADVVLALDGDDVQVFDQQGFTAEAAHVRTSFPMARLRFDRPLRTLPGAGPALRRRWQLALSAEIVGCASAALDLTLAFARERKQFGRAIGSFQAIQHRLAECTVAVETVRWLVREAAYHGAPALLAGIAATTATNHASRLLIDTHQVMGARGLIYETDLHLWTLRIRALRGELGGVGAHARTVFQAAVEALPAVQGARSGPS
ncbi:acyl-CoA dehydrogenase family protein [Geodermatophilus sp. URMC 64]